MEDIEDLEDAGPDPRQSRSIRDSHVIVEQRGRQGVPEAWQGVPEARQGVQEARQGVPGAWSPPGGGAQSSVPGTQRIWLKTFGCSHNSSDAEYMAGLLTEYGYRRAPLPCLAAPALEPGSG